MNDNHSAFSNAAQTDPSRAAPRGCVRYLYELPKVVFNHKAYYLDRRLEEPRNVRDPNDKIDLEVYEMEMERRRQRGLQRETEVRRMLTKVRARDRERSM
jgi:hypothetical protein